MSEVSEAMETQQTDYKNDLDSAPEFEPVCVDVDRIYDSCGAKDCIRDLTVFFTDEDQQLVETATAARVTRASVLTSTVNVDSVAFHRGYFSVDVAFYFAVFVELYTAAGSAPRQSIPRSSTAAQRRAEHCREPRFRYLIPWYSLRACLR